VVERLDAGDPSPTLITALASFAEDAEFRERVLEILGRERREKPGDVLRANYFVIALWNAGEYQAALTEAERIYFAACVHQRCGPSDDIFAKLLVLRRQLEAVGRARNFRFVDGGQMEALGALFERATDLADQLGPDPVVSEEMNRWWGGDHVHVAVVFRVWHAHALRRAGKAQAYVRQVEETCRVCGAYEDAADCDELRDFLTRGVFEETQTK
jgi:hypothetical protein